jgi:agmatinase
MTDLSLFDPNAAGNPNNNIFGLPFTEEDARLVLLPVPWEVTVSYGAGTARAPEHLFKSSLQIDLYDADIPDGWKQGFHMRESDRKILLKSDYLRKEAELYINFISQGENLANNKFMCKALREVNEGSLFLNRWVYEQTLELMERGKLVGVIGGDHSCAYGYIKAMAEKHGEFGILQIDAHCDLRESYEGFHHSHASVMYNVLRDTPNVKKLVQVGIRDYSQSEWDYVCSSDQRVVCYMDKKIKERQYEGETWKHICDEIVGQLPANVYLSFDIDGLDPKLCPNTGTPVQGGMETEQVFYLVKRVIESGRRLLGFDLCEIGVSTNEWDENVGARVVFRLCHYLVASNPAT